MKPIAVPENEIDTAFAALAEVADMFAGQGRRCFAATAKPALRARVHGFDETLLGYATFREFLLDAERRRVVKLAFVGQDYQIIPAGAADAVLTSGEAAPQRERPGRQRIKRAFWNAVVVLRGAERWFYDPNDHLVVADSGDTPAEGLVELPRAGTDTQQGWINDFASGLESGDAEELRERVAGFDGLPDKLRAVSSRTDTRAAWYDYRARRVTELLEEWKDQHGLDVDLFDHGRALRRAPAPRAVHARRSKDDELRARLHRAIDQMPVSELLRLSVPIEYIVDR